MPNENINAGEVYKDESLASNYDRTMLKSLGKDYGEMYEEDINFLLDLMPISPEDVVVDLGCGTGISTKLILGRNAGKVIGVDFSEAMLRQAKEKFIGHPKAEFRLGSAEELSDVVKTADAVVSANTFGYIQEPGKALQQVHSVLVPNGKYLFNVKIESGKKDYNIYLIKASEEAISEVLGEKVELPIPASLKPRHNQKTLTELARKNSFEVTRYLEKSSDHQERHIRAIYENALRNMARILKDSIGEEKTQRILERAGEKLEAFYRSEDFEVLRAAYVCLRKIED
jgi:ubiquinone/menaquinone biosynthesis C-methylase UbiE